MVLKIGYTLESPRELLNFDAWFTLQTNQISVSGRGVWAPEVFLGGVLFFNSVNDSFES